MKTRIILSFFFLVFMVIDGNAYEIRPVAVSPCSESGVAVVGQSCPTFSWSAVQGAEAYRVMVFKAVGSEILAYEEMEAKGYTVINKEIRGPALSWTPSEEERLINGEAYVWYVQAVDAYGGGIWSEGRMFIVGMAEGLAGVEEKVRYRLREYGVNEETITEVLKGFKPGSDERGSGYMTQGLIGITGTEDDLNTFYGKDAGASTIGIANSFFGARAGYKNVGGSNNAFLGYEAGYNNLGPFNSFFGAGAGYKTTTGSNNTFIGAYNGYENTTGRRNTFSGCYVGYENTTGESNTFTGYSAGHKNTTGSNNTFLGSYAGYSNTKVSNNTFIGYCAGYYNTTGDNNTIIGHYAGTSNTKGFRNTFLGSYAGYKNTAGQYNTFIGNNAGYKNTAGRYNTFIGNNTGYNNTSGSKNIFLGRKAGYYETGSNKLYIDSSDTRSPLIYGRFDTNIVTINGKLGVGKNPTKLIHVKGGAYCSGREWINASSRKYKENIQSLNAEEAKDALERLNPVKFNYKRDKGDEHVGFIAEEVPDLVATKNRKGLSAMDVVAVLTKVVQEQQKVILDLKDRILELEKKK